VEAPVGLVDVLPTLRALTGLPRDARNEGLSLASALEGRARGWAERTLFAHLVTFEEGAVHEAVLDGRFKLITTGGVSRLFDIVDDPREERDLSAERPDLVRRLRDRYQAFAGASRTYVELPTTQDLPPDAVEQLKALGYIK
jgi:arylsulfatase A-like enzyme